MQPLQYDLKSPAAKDNSITNAATARSNLDTAIYIAGNDPTVAKHNGIPSATPPPAPLAIPFTLREGSYSCKSQWNSICNPSSSTTCNPIYIGGNDPTVANHNGILSTTHARKTFETPFTMRNRSDHDPETDPNMIRT